MTLGWKIFWGALIIAGGSVIYRAKRKEPVSFEDYCNKCIEQASKESMASANENVVKTILVLAKNGETIVSPFLYRSYNDGKIKKKRVDYKSFPFDSCPPDVRDAIQKGEYVVYRF